MNQGNSTWSMNDCYSTIPNINTNGPLPWFCSLVKWKKDKICSLQHALTAYSQYVTISRLIQRFTCIYWTFTTISYQCPVWGQHIHVNYGKITEQREAKWNKYSMAFSPSQSVIKLHEVALKVDNCQITMINKVKMIKTNQNSCHKIPQVKHDDNPFSTVLWWSCPSHYYPHYYAQCQPRNC